MEMKKNIISFLGKLKHTVFWIEISWCKPKKGPSCIILHDKLQLEYEENSPLANAN